MICEFCGGETGTALDPDEALEYCSDDCREDALNDAAQAKLDGMEDARWG